MTDWQEANLALRRRRDEVNAAKRAEQQVRQIEAYAADAARQKRAAQAAVDDFVHLFGTSPA